MPTPLFWLKTFGIDLQRTWTAIRNLPHYQSDRHRIKRSMEPNFSWGREIPMLHEKSASSGSLGAYFFQDLLVAKWIYQDSPKHHVDVGSRLDGFIGHLAVFRTVEVLDIRPQPKTIPNVSFRQLDLMDDLTSQWNDYTTSLSCLHTIEHFGLGRYADRIDAMGYRKGITHLKSMVKPGGRLYLSTPIGPQRVEFNAHRIFSTQTVIDWFKDGWKIERFAYLDDSETLHTDVDLNLADCSNDFGCTTGLAILSARKLEPSQ